MHFDTKSDGCKENSARRQAALERNARLSDAQHANDGKSQLNSEALGTGSDVERYGKASTCNAAAMLDAELELISYKDALNRHTIAAVTDAEGIIVNVNDPFCEISQYSREELIGRTHAILNSNYHPREFFAQLWTVISSGQIWHGDICNRAKDGALYWVDTTIAPKWNAKRVISGYVSIRYDITKRKLAEASRAEENLKRKKAEALLWDVLESVPDAILAFDADDRLILCNAAFKEIYRETAHAIQEGISYEDLLRLGVENGQFVFSRYAPASQEAWIAAQIKEHKDPGKRVIQQLASGRWVLVQERRSANGHVVGVRTDITELKLAEDSIRRQAERDPLTGLFNRRALLDRLEQALSAKQRPHVIAALIIADLDGFKSVNDTLGHQVGDEVLVCIAERFHDAVRRHDVVARLGGDEFALILSNLTDEDDALRLVKRLVAVAKRPVEVGAQSLACASSFGVAFLHKDGGTPKDLLKHADIALYEAKARGRGTYCVFEPSLRERVDRDNALAEALRAAIARDEIEIALQPQTDFSTGRHSGFEALARWQHAGQPVAPAEFIPVAEEAGLIVELGRRVLEKALMALRNLRKRRIESGPVAVNVAAAQLLQQDFVHTIRSTISRFGLEPRDLEIEVTENVLLDRAVDGIGRSLDAIHELGVRIALDDFGTGFASLSHLQRFPVSRIKIDKSFVRGLDQRKGDEIIISAIINLAHSLGIQVVAEGIETEEQYKMLSSYRCDFAQGFFISRPLRVELVEKYLCMQRSKFFRIGEYTDDRRNTQPRLLK